MSTPRFGVIWPDGSYTGGITDHQRLAMRYAQTDGGKWYEVGGAEDPERVKAFVKPGRLLCAESICDECATTKKPQAQEEDFSDLC